MKEKRDSGESASTLTRRRFLQTAGAASAVGVPLVAAHGDELPRLSESDPTAIALKYVHDASSLDSSVRPADRLCNNCALYSGSADDEWAACSIFPGKAVAGRGWCSVWAPKG